MKMILAIIFFIFLYFDMKSQNIELSICEKDSIKATFEPNMIMESYSPYNFEDTVKYKVEDLGIFFDGKKFLKIPTSDNIGFFFYHEGEKGELYWLDEKEKKVKLLIPADEIEGYESKDGVGNFTKIVGYHVKIETPVCIYNDAIMILVKQSEFYDYSHAEVFYYVRGVGWVAREYRDMLISYMVKRYIVVEKK